MCRNYSAHIDSQGLAAVETNSMHYAAYNGQVDAVAVLLAAGADPEMVSDDGETALALCSATAARRARAATAW